MNAIYLKGLVRRIRHNKVYFAINIIGLSIALSAAMLIFIWVGYEKSYDITIPGSKDIYRVYSNIQMNGNNFTSAMAPPPLAAVLSGQFPDVLASTRVWSYENLTVGKNEGKAEEKIINEKRVYQADSNFFSFFNFSFLQGDPLTALVNPNSIVLTRTAALRYFSKGEFADNGILGKTLTLGFFGRCKVTGVCEDLPPNIHFHFDIIISNSSDPWYKSNVWVDNTYYTYIKLRENTNPAALESKLPAIIKTYLDPQLNVNFGTSYDKLRSTGSYWEYKLQSTRDIHLRSNFERELEPNADIRNVYLLGTVACFILLMACINYANLTMAYFMDRSREIGLHKTFGSSRFKVAMLVFNESCIITFVSAVIAGILIVVFVQPFGQLMGSSFPADILYSSKLWLLFMSVSLLVSILGSAYPGITLSLLKVIDAVKGQTIERKKVFGFKKALVVTQFAISIGFVVCTVSVYKQFMYLKEKETGFNKDNIVVIADPTMKLGKKTYSFLKELNQHDAIKSATICSDYPGSGIDNFPVAANNRRDKADLMLTHFNAGYDFIQTFGMTLSSGRDFSEVLDHDTVQRVILNETAVRKLQLDKPLNSLILTKTLNALTIQEKKYEVIGVVKDFNFESLHSPIRPIAIFLNPGGNFICIRIKPTGTKSTLGAVEHIWKSFLPTTPFEYHFLDEKMETLYRNESRLHQMLRILSLMVIFIASMGLVGLTAVMIKQRTKEIGVRKVLGAGVTDIIYLINRQYLKGIALSFVIACPLSYWLINRWLQHFAYKAPMTIWPYLITGVAAVLATLIITGFQSSKAAMQNPVNSLRVD